MEINVSFLKSNRSLVETIALLNKSTATGIHVDFMDNTFVNNTSLPLAEMHLETITKPLEIHVMVNDPLKYLEAFSKYRPKHYIFHLEAVNNPLEVIMEIIKKGIRPGLAINPETSLSELKPYLKYVDTILLMSVTPGAGGQPFIPETSKRLSTLRKMYKGRIEVDGGINPQTISQVKEANASVSGSFICMSANYEESIQELKKALETKKSL